ncbi:MAG: GerAB/ArcD/ProY family transporter [Sulfobacillus sp.]
MKSEASDRLPRISAMQFATMVTSGYIALGIFYFPRQAVSVAGRNGIWSIILDGLVTWGLMHLIFWVGRLVPNETLTTFAPKILTKPIGLLLGTYTVIYHLVLAIAAATLFGFVLGDIFLPETPQWALVLSLVATAVYMGWGGTAGLARTLQAGYTPVAILTLLTGMATSTLVRHPVLLLPPANFTLFPVLRGAWNEYIIFIGFQLSVTLYPFIRNEQRKQAERYTYIALGGVTAILVIEYEVAMSTFGPSYISQLRWPLVSLMRILSVQGFFIDKFGLLVVALWTIIVAGFVSVRLWCLAHDIMAIAHQKTTKAYHFFLSVSGAAVVLGTTLIPNAEYARILNEKYLVPAGILYLTGVPALVLTVARFRKKLVTNLRTSPEVKPAPPS